MSGCLAVVTLNALAHAYTKHAAPSHGQGKGNVESVDQRDARRQQTAEALAVLQADVVLLQEHDHDFEAGGHKAIRRARATRPDGQPMPEGCTIMVPEASTLPPFDRSEGFDIGDGKSAAVAAWESPNLTVGTFHLSGGPGSDSAKAAQLAAVLAVVERLATEDARVVLAGDCNCANPGSHPSFQCLWDAGFSAVPYDGTSGLSSDFSVALPLDHVFVRNSTAACRLPFGDACNPYGPDCKSGSDHSPVLALIPL
jgi:endonuclease/exonuclease/phosphatase family metal-dependent hydrolase